MSRTINIIIAGILVIVLGYIAYVLVLRDANQNFQGGSLLKNFSSFNKLDASKSSIDLDLLFSSGPGKDGIPAINKPKFESVDEATVDLDRLGVFVDFKGQQRFYPYNILVWHEIVNDQIDDLNFAVTFSPLCGATTVFDRNVNGQILDFGVSGLLYESNLVMYDQQTQSFWPQTMREAAVGSLLGAQLKIMPMQLISFKELKNKYPHAKVLSRDTGYSKNYDFYPYGGYEATDELYFPISKTDKRLPLKEIMFVVPLDNNSLAIQQKNLNDKAQMLEIKEGKLKAEKNGEEIKVTLNDQLLAGYYEMWFSWAIHHQKDGIVWEISK